MKKIKILLSLFCLITFAISCTDEDGISDDLSSVNSSEPNAITGVFDISNDNSGRVKIIPTGEGVTVFQVDPGHGNVGLVNVAPGNNLIHFYPEGNYTVTIISVGITGIVKEETIPLTVTYRAPENIETTWSFSGYDINVTAKADYANGFLIYFGDVSNESPTVMEQNDDSFTATHTYLNDGMFTLKVVALSGGVATSEETYEISVYPLRLPMTFDNPNINYIPGGTFGDVVQEVVANPQVSGINTSANVLKYTKPVGVPNWSGTYTPMGLPVDFSQGNKIKLLFYASEAGKEFNVELEWAVGGFPENGVAVKKVANTTANQWEELVFDFSTISGIPADAKFTQIVFRYNDITEGAGEVIYIDNIRLTN